MPLAPVPHLHVGEVPVGSVSAELTLPGWHDVEPVYLCDTVTGESPRQKTAVRVATSGSCLRVLFECEDQEPWATRTKRDDRLFEEEVVEVFLDPVGDLEAYFEIQLNPLNTAMDLVLRRSPSGVRKDFAWACEGLRTATQRTASGWTAELAIPFESLLPDSRQMSPWRCNFLRIDRPSGQERELSAWSPTGVPQFHASHRFGYLHLAL